MTVNIIFNLVLVGFALLYLLGCRVHLVRIMPIVSVVFSSPMRRNQAMQKISYRLLCSILFCLGAWGFALFRGHYLMQHYGVDAVTGWGVLILVGMYGAYTLFLHTIFSQVAAYARATQPAAYQEQP